LYNINISNSEIKYIWMYKSIDLLVLEIFMPILMLQNLYLGGSMLESEPGFCPCWDLWSTSVSWSQCQDSDMPWLPSSKLTHHLPISFYNIFNSCRGYMFVKWPKKQETIHVLIGSISYGLQEIVLSLVPNFKDPVLFATHNTILNLLSLCKQSACGS
jgi:hypothetical protein